MKYYFGKSKFYTTVLPSLLLILNSIFTPVVASAANLPNCGIIISWAARAYELDENVKSSNYWGGTYQNYKYTGKYLVRQNDEAGNQKSRLL